MTRRQQLKAFTKIARAAALVSTLEGRTAICARVLLDDVAVAIEASLASALTRRRRGRRS